MKMKAGSYTGRDGENATNDKPQYRVVIPASDDGKRNKNPTNNPENNRQNDGDNKSVVRRGLGTCEDETIPARKAIDHLAPQIDKALGKCAGPH